VVKLGLLIQGIPAYEVLSDDEVSTLHLYKLALNTIIIFRNEKLMTDTARSDHSIQLLPPTQFRSV